MSFDMNITVDTVRTYVKNVLTKLGVHSRLELAALASREGLLIDRRWRRIPSRAAKRESEQGQ